MKGLFTVALLIPIITGGVAFARAQVSYKSLSYTTNLFPGEIKSVSEADITKGTRSEIVVIDADGLVKTFLVKIGTTIYADNGKPLILKNLQPGNSVKVLFKASPEGILEATAIYQTR